MDEQLLGPESSESEQQAQTQPSQESLGQETEESEQGILEQAQETEESELVEPEGLGGSESEQGQEQQVEQTEQVEQVEPEQQAGEGASEEAMSGEDNTKELEIVSESDSGDLESLPEPGSEMVESLDLSFEQEEAISGPEAEEMSPAGTDLEEKARPGSGGSKQLEDPGQTLEEPGEQEPTGRDIGQ